MGKNKIEALVTPVAEAIAKDLDVEFVDVEYVKEGNWILRVFIDKPGGVFIDDCERFSERLSDKLDEIDPIPQSYRLEVSSPGIERPLRKDSDYIKAKGKKIEVNTFAALDGKKTFIGELRELTDEKLSLMLQDHRIMEIPREKIAHAKLVAEFHEFK